MKSGLLNPEHLKCKTAAPGETKSSKLKAFSYAYTFVEGAYEINFEDEEVMIKISHREPMITTECRQIEYIKHCRVSG